MIDFTNYKKHPSEPNYMVLFFDHEPQASYFEELLQEHKVQFEKEIQEGRSFYVYFGVHKDDFELVKKLNEISKGKYRKPFIPDKALRYTVLFIFFIVFTFALIGYVVTELK